MATQVKSWPKRTCYLKTGQITAQEAIEAVLPVAFSHVRFVLTNILEDLPVAEPEHYLYQVSAPFSEKGGMMTERTLPT